MSDSLLRHLARRTGLETMNLLSRLRCGVHQGQEARVELARRAVRHYRQALEWIGNRREQPMLWDNIERDLAAAVLACSQIQEGTVTSGKSAPLKRGSEEESSKRLGSSPKKKKK